VCYEPAWSPYQPSFFITSHRNSFFTLHFLITTGGVSYTKPPMNTLQLIISFNSLQPAFTARTPPSLNKPEELSILPRDKKILISPPQVVHHESATAPFNPDPISERLSEEPFPYPYLSKSVYSPVHGARSQVP
jgi:hypothetical protein